MNAKIIVSALALFLLSATLTEGVSLTQTKDELKCQCVNTHSKFIHPKYIQDVSLTQRGPHCQNNEIIATLKDGREVCLDPTANWVKAMTKKMLEKTEANVDHCNK
uniref:C-X-C motif chemokine n=1 Tax=Salvator merianae TaxID=96440 RepID=A0A8D0DWK2_SALMN